MAKSAVQLMYDPIFFFNELVESINTQISLRVAKNVQIYLYLGSASYCNFQVRHHKNLLNSFTSTTINNFGGKFR